MTTHDTMSQHLTSKFQNSLLDKLDKILKRLDEVEEKIELSNKGKAKSSPKKEK